MKRHETLNGDLRSIHHRDLARSSRNQKKDCFHHEGTKDTKGSDDLDSELRAPFDFAQDMLRVLRGESISQ